MSSSTSRTPASTKVEDANASYDLALKEHSIIPLVSIVYTISPPSQGCAYRMVKTPGGPVRGWL